MPPRCCPLTVYLLVGKSRKWQTLTFCGRCNIFDASEKFSVTLLPFCVAGAIFSCPARSSSWSYVLFVWQVQYFRCLREIPSWPGPMIACDPTSFLRGRCHLFDASEKFSVTLRKVACGPSSFLCGRCKCLATMVTLLPFCAAGAIFSMPPRSSSFVWQAQYFRKTPVPPSYTLKGGCTYKAICLSTMWFSHFETLPPPQSPP